MEEKVIVPKPGETCNTMGEHLWKLAGLTNSDINRVVKGGVWNGAHEVAVALKQLGYRVVDRDGNELAMTSLIHIWLQGIDVPRWTK